MSQSRSFRRGEILRMAMPQAIGTEIKKDRPWVVLSPDSVNAAETTLLVAPITSGRHPYPFRVAFTSGGAQNQIVLDQLKCVHTRRVRQRVGVISPQALKASLATLREMFAE